MTEGFKNYIKAENELSKKSILDKALPYIITFYIGVAFGYFWCYKALIR